MFSVIITLYNKEQSIANTIQSVLDQTFQEFEIVIVNDGSTDSSVDQVMEINDLRIRIINKTNGGVSSARNVGIEEAEYEWIAFLDGDDFWEKEHLATIKHMMDLFLEDKVFTTSFIRSNKSMPEKKDNSIVVIDNYFKEVLSRSVTWTSIMCAHKSVFENVGLFNEKLNRGEDLDMWARIGRQYRYIKSNRVTARYMINIENSLTSNLQLLERYYIVPKYKVKDKYETKYNLKLGSYLFFDILFSNKKSTMLQFFRLYPKYFIGICNMILIDKIKSTFTKK